MHFFVTNLFGRIWRRLYVVLGGVSVSVCPGCSFTTKPRCWRPSVTGVNTTSLTVPDRMTDSDVCTTKTPQEMSVECSMSRAFLSKHNTVMRNRLHFIDGFYCQFAHVFKESSRVTCTLHRGASREFSNRRPVTDNHGVAHRNQKPKRNFSF